MHVALIILPLLLGLALGWEPVLPLHDPAALLSVHGAPHVHRRGVQGEPGRYVHRTEYTDIEGDGYALLDYDITIVAGAVDLQDVLDAGGTVLADACSEVLVPVALPSDAARAATVMRLLMDADYLFHSTFHYANADVPLCGREEGVLPLYRIVLDVEPQAGGRILGVHTTPASLMHLLQPGSRISLRHRPSLPSPHGAEAARARRKALDAAPNNDHFVAATDPTDGK